MGFRPASVEVASTQPLISLGLRCLCAPKAGSWLGAWRGNEGVGVETATGNKHLCTVTTHTHTHTRPISHGHPTLHSRSPPSTRPLSLANGVGVWSEDRPKIQPVSFLLNKTWAVHPHCKGHGGSLDSQNRVGSLSKGQDSLPSPEDSHLGPAWTLPTPPNSSLRHQHRPSHPAPNLLQPWRRLMGVTNETGIPAAPGQGRVSQTLVEAGDG